MELIVPLTDYKSPKNLSSISCPHLPCPRISQMLMFLGLPNPLEHCQHALGIRFTKDYPILLSNLTLGLWKFTSHDAYNITPYVKRDTIWFQYDTIMCHWDSCGPFNCLYLHPLTLLKGGSFFKGTYFHLNWSAKMWARATPVKVTISSHIGRKAIPVYVRPPFFFLVSIASIIRDSLNCFNEECLLIACRNVYSTMAVLMRESGTIWVPVINMTHFHAIILMAHTHLQAPHWGKERLCYYGCQQCGNHCRHCQDSNSCCSLDPDSHNARDCPGSSLWVTWGATDTGEIKLTSLSSHTHFTTFYLLAEELVLVRDISVLPCDPRLHSICLIHYQVYNTTEPWKRLNILKVSGQKNSLTILCC